MLYQVINDWVTQKITLLNNSLTPEERLKLSDANFEMDFLPSNLKDNSYLIKLESIKIEDNESGEIKVNTVIEFHFRLYKKPIGKYKTLIDEKLVELCKLLTDDSAAGLEYTSGEVTIANIHNLTVTGLEKAYKGGEYIFPKIEFVLQVFNN
ncbi:MAG: hypothetical protein ABI543_13195 [Ignavibacteria bacterium]